MEIGGRSIVTYESVVFGALRWLGAIWRYDEFSCSHKIPISKDLLEEKFGIDSSSGLEHPRRERDTYGTLWVMG